MALAKAVVGQLVKRPAPLNGALNGLVKQPIPPLESGDRLTRVEFERRYHAMPPHIRAELIEGVVHMSSPVRHEYHGQPHNRTNMLFGLYATQTIGVDCSDNVTVRLDLDNEPQPDVVLFIKSGLGGRMSLSKDNYLEGSPELVLEVAASTVSIDLHSKLQAYRRNGVLEYIVWRTGDNALDWFQWVNEQYVRVLPDDKGVIRSQVFPGLWLNVAALLQRDYAAALTTMQQGLKSKEHAAFVRELKRRAKARSKA